MVSSFGVLFVKDMSNVRLFLFPRFIVSINTDTQTDHQHQDLPFTRVCPIKQLNGDWGLTSLNWGPPGTTAPRGWPWLVNTASVRGLGCICTETGAWGPVVNILCFICCSFMSAEEWIYYLL